MGPWGWDHMLGGWGWGGMMLLGGLLMLLFWGGIIVLAFFAIRALVRSEGRGDRDDWQRPGEPNALEILKERYARGEISREEYLDMRRDLET